MPRKRRRLPGFLHLPVYFAVRAMVAAMLAGDLNANLATARSVGRAYARLEKKRFQRVLATLRVAFPDHSPEQLNEHALQAYEHLFMLAVETACTPRLMCMDSWADHLRMGDLGPAVREIASGRPAVLITGHCGNWELLGYSLAVLGFPVHALYRPLDLEPLDRWVRRTRERRGLVLLDKFGATERLPTLMAGGGLAGFIADQNAGDRGLFVPFFNRLASTYKSIGLMALQYEAPILCGQARRLVWDRDGHTEAGEQPEERRGRVGFAGWTGEPFKYRIDVIDIIRPEDWKDQPDPLFYVSARYRRALEEMVRRAPEQNLWLHRYWKSRPRHERLGRPLPGALKDKIRALPWITPDDLLRIEEWSARDSRTLAETGKTTVPL